MVTESYSCPQATRSRPVHTTIWDLNGNEEYWLRSLGGNAKELQPHCLGRRGVKATALSGRPIPEFVL
jgi:hypothetical protein